MTVEESRLKVSLISSIQSKTMSDIQVKQAVSRLMDLEGTNLKEVTVCLAALRRIGAWQAACSLLHEIRAKGLKPNIITYSAAISVCERARQWQAAVGLLREADNRGVCPNVIAYSAAISACEKCHRCDQAIELLEEMKKRGIKPDVIAYNATISACEKGGKPETALKLLQEMISNDVAFSTISYNACISAFARKGQWDDCLLLLEDMWNRKIPTDAITYKAIIKACEKSSHWEFIFDILGNMDNDGVQLDATLSCLIFSLLLKSAEFDLALQFHKVLIPRAVNVTTPMLLNIMCAAERLGDHKTILGLTGRIFPHIDHLPKVIPKCALNTCNRAKEFGSTIELFEKFRSLGAELDTTVYQILICACAGQQNWELALLYFEEMQINGVLPNTLIFNVAMISCSMNHNLSSLYTIFMKYAESNEITTSSLNIAIESGLRAARMDLVNDWLAFAEENGIATDKSTKRIMYQYSCNATVA